MINNDILRRLRYALSLDDAAMTEVFRLGDVTIDRTRLTGFLKKEGAEGFIACSGQVMSRFLDGLIVHKRGRKESAPGTEKRAIPPLTNNAILRKLRIALELHEDDMLDILKAAGMDISRAELSALFRKEGHRNYKECGDQILRKFLKGLTLRFRGSGDDAY